MQEKFVTVAGARHDLPAPFHVLATQNPIEQEGTYPLPEAQLDRFLFQINVDFPTLETERQILLATTGASTAAAKGALTAKQLMDMQKLVRKLPVGETVLEAILTLVRNARPDNSPIDSIRKTVSWGPGPRAGQALMLASRAKALIEGRLSPSVDDVLELAEPVLQHRMALNYTVYFWRDGGPGMNWQSSSKVPTKIDRASILSMSLAILLMQAGERCAVMGETNMPRTGRIGLERIALRLAGSTGETSNLSADIPAHARLVISSDFLEGEAVWQGRLARLSARPAKGILVHIIDPAERDFPFKGRMKLRFPGFSKLEPLLVGRAEQAPMPR